MTTMFIVSAMTVIAVVCNVYFAICVDKLIIKTDNINVHIATFIFVFVMENSKPNLVIVIAAVCDVYIRRDGKFMINTNIIGKRPKKPKSDTPIPNKQ